MLTYLVNCFSCDSAVERYKVNSVLCVKSYDVNKVLCGQSVKVSLIVNYTVVNGHRAYHSRTFVRKLLPERLCVAVA